MGPSLVQTKTTHKEVALTDLFMLCFSFILSSAYSAFAEIRVSFQGEQLHQNYLYYRLSDPVLCAYHDTTFFFRRRIVSKLALCCFQLCIYLLHFHCRTMELWSYSIVLTSTKISSQLTKFRLTKCCGKCCGVVGFLRPTTDQATTKSKFNTEKSSFVIYTFTQTWPILSFSLEYHELSSSNLRNQGPRVALDYANASADLIFTYGRCPKIH